MKNRTSSPKRQVNQSQLSALSAFLNERSWRFPGTAIRIREAFGISMETLMRMQNSFDIAQAHKREGDIQVQPYVAKAETDPQPNLV